MDKVTVIQADRDAAAAVIMTEKKWPGLRDRAVAELRAGVSDDYVLIQAFAKHREAFATPAPDSEKLREAGEYVAGPVYRSSMEPEGDVWSAEVQITGGHYVAAEVYGSTEAEARTRQSAIIAALGASL